MTINELQDEIIEEFSQFDDWMDKYALLIDLGNSLEVLDEKHKTPQNIIEGCQSRVWLNAEMNDGIITYQGESDAILVKGSVSLLTNESKSYLDEYIRISRGIATNINQIAHKINLGDYVDVRILINSLKYYEDEFKKFITKS